MSATDQSTSPTSITRETWADLIALEPASAAAAPERKAPNRSAQQAALLLAPIALAWIVMKLLPPVYQSDTSFILRHQAEPLSLPSSGGDFAGVPADGGSADSYAVRDYLLSRDAMAASGGNFAGATTDARFSDFSRRVSVGYETSSGVITIHARAGSAAQARDLALGLETAVTQLVKRFDQSSAASEYLAPLAEPNLTDGPAGQNQPLILLGATALGLALAWSRRA